MRWLLLISLINFTEHQWVGNVFLLLFLRFIWWNTFKIYFMCAWMYAIYVCKKADEINVCKKALALCVDFVTSGSQTNGYSKLTLNPSSNPQWYAFPSYFPSLKRQKLFIFNFFQQ